MKRGEKIHLFYLSNESWPTFRPDLATLFGKYLPRLGITGDLVTEHDQNACSDNMAWGGGRTLLCTRPRGRVGQYLQKSWHSLRMLMRCDRDCYDAIQVRDMPAYALAGLIAARLKRMPFFYWMSFPIPEGHLMRAKARGPSAGIRYWFPLAQGILGKWLIYRVVLPYADHVFVQSRKMREDVSQYGIPPQRITAVPMGVDFEVARPELILPSDDPRLEGKRVIAYLGTLDRGRQIETLFEMLAIVRQSEPEALLVLAGDTEDDAHRVWLKREAERRGVAHSVLWTGWLPTQQAWRYVRAAEVGVSLIPRGFLLDCGSPTKAIEYMALGLAVVVNDNPDQEQLVREGSGGLCVSLDPAAVAQAVLRLLADPPCREKMAAAGRHYVMQVRSYEKVAENVEAVYRSFFNARSEERGA